MLLDVLGLCALQASVVKLVKYLSCEQDQASSLSLGNTGRVFTVFVEPSINVNVVLYHRESTVAAWALYNNKGPIFPTKLQAKPSEISSQNKLKSS